MRLTVLGCRAGMPADGQASSGYLVDTGSAHILLDCGPGAATALSGVAVNGVSGNAARPGPPATNRTMCGPSRSVRSTSSSVTGRAIWQTSEDGGRPGRSARRC